MAQPEIQFHSLRNGWARPQLCRKRRPRLRSLDLLPALIRQRRWICHPFSAQFPPFPLGLVLFCLLRNASFEKKVKLTPVLSSSREEVCVDSAGGSWSSSCECVGAALDRQLSVLRRQPVFCNAKE
eukprot:1736839-Rhodomonas_salina.2